MSRDPRVEVVAAVIRAENAASMTPQWRNMPYEAFITATARRVVAALDEHVVNAVAAPVCVTPGCTNRALIHPPHCTTHHRGEAS